MSDRITWLKAKAEEHQDTARRVSFEPHRQMLLASAARCLAEARQLEEYLRAEKAAGDDAPVQRGGASAPLSAPPVERG